MQKFEKRYPLPSSCVKMQVFSLKMDYNDLSKNMFLVELKLNVPISIPQSSVLSNGISILFVLTRSIGSLCLALY